MGMCMGETETKRVIESLRHMANELEDGEARLEEWESKLVWREMEVTGKNIDVWVKYD